MRFILLFYFLFGYSQISLTAQTEDPFSEMQVSLLTCRNGDELYTTFGHTALRLYNPVTEADIVYNYGTFDFNTPYFYIKFLRGKLPYKLADTSMSRFMRAYQYEERSVIEQKLQLTSAQKELLVKKLSENIKPENRFYKYDFFFDNCTTRTMDLLEDVTGPLTFDNEVKDITFRGMLKENLKGLPWSEFGIDLVIGAVADQKTTRRNQYFLPIYLHDAINEATLPTQQPVATSDRTILNFEARDAERKIPPTPWPMILAVALLLIEILLVFLPPSTFKTVYDKVWMWLMAIMGLVMAFMWFATDHLATKQNYNLLWANPLFIGYLKLQNTKIKKGLLIALIIMSIAAMLNGFVQFLPQYFHPTFSIFALINVLKLVRSQRLISTANQG